jgi:Carboxypeptidase regulatory-like domain
MRVIGGGGRAVSSLMLLLPYVLLLSSFCFVLSAAGIRGNVVEHQTGKSLARALVDLQPVAGTPGSAVSMRTNHYGAFEFHSLAAGAYVLKVSRRGFVPIEHGQKRWDSAGQPIVLTPDASPFVTIRLPRYGAITGMVVDENDVGLSQHDVVAYRSTQPPRMVARGASDERGVYRISGLEPGTYVVRSAGKQDEAIEYVPTFSRETLRYEEARPVQVYLDEDAKGANVRPLSGKLFTLSGIAEPSPANAGPVSVVLASDTGRLRVQGPAFRFESLPPGQYELYAESPENPKMGWKFQAAYLQMNINSNPAPVSLSVQPIRETRFEFASGPSDTAALEILARRKDYAGVEQPQRLRLDSDRALLPPGRWEVMLPAPSGYYVAGFLGPVRGVTAKVRPDGMRSC